MILKNVEKNFPFISVITYGGNEYVGIIANQDTLVTNMYLFSLLHTDNHRKLFLELGNIWWWESNRMIPINIFLAGEFSPYQNWLKTFTTKDVKMIFGPTTSLNNIVRKRIKRRQIQLVKKTDR